MKKRREREIDNDFNKKNLGEEPYFTLADTYTKPQYCAVQTRKSTSHTMLQKGIFGMKKSTCVHNQLIHIFEDWHLPLNSKISDVLSLIAKASHCASML